tara:strand:- start:1141 stop:1371 length:231 start_codon:yes stop_codon:yes gene_type:complete
MAHFADCVGGNLMTSVFTAIVRNAVFNSAPILRVMKRSLMRFLIVITIMALFVDSVGKNLAISARRSPPSTALLPL